ncbi:uncharacterized protein LOC123507200 isoform X2 [Portunus trituberculatus]|uniref:uncharacterized protein LOC123507200 isoform X2 n=1 Tax=Portunus trituberculatus TaxID=210409 RepID=UPI001E1CB72F|nr:uncharacterized protein LOC123507200 isoform X2 [Portunus trituberculatus]
MIRDSRRFSLGLELWKNTTALAAFTTSCLSTSLSSASLLPTIHSSPCKRFSLGNGLCEEYYRTGCLHDKLLLVRVPLLPLCCPTSHFSRYKTWLSTMSLPLQSGKEAPLPTYRPDQHNTLCTYI